jgi:hypothetical protein
VIIRGGENIGALEVDHLLLRLVVGDFPRTASGKV